MEQKKRPHEDPWRALGLIGIVGVTLAACVSGGFLLGQYISGFWGGIFTVLTGVLIGLAVGIMCIIPMIREFTGD